jgi:hypothetical protein
MRRGVLQLLFPWSRSDLQLRTPSLSFEVDDDFPSVRGDSVKVRSPFGGALGKTSRCGERHTLPPCGCVLLPACDRHTGEVLKSAVACESDGGLWITEEPSLRPVCESSASRYGREARTEPRPRFRPPQSPTPMEVKSGASFPLPLRSRSVYSPACGFGSTPACGRAATPITGSNAVTTMLSTVRRIVS